VVFVLPMEAPPIVTPPEIAVFVVEADAVCPPAVWVVP
jgi:hypothetical protein